jgi:hypothetical protein
MSHTHTTLLRLHIVSLERPERGPALKLDECPRCGDALHFSQPDAQNPDRLIGACSCCGHWFLFEQPEFATRIAVLEVPPEAWRQALLPIPSAAEASSDRAFQAGA